MEIIQYMIMNIRRLFIALCIIVILEAIFFAIVVITDAFQKAGESRPDYPIHIHDTISRDTVSQDGPIALLELTTFNGDVWNVIYDSDSNRFIYYDLDWNFLDCDWDTILYIISNEAGYYIVTDHDTIWIQ